MNMGCLLQSLLTGQLSDMIVCKESPLNLMDGKTGLASPDV